MVMDEAELEIGEYVWKHAVNDNIPVHKKYQRYQFDTLHYILINCQFYLHVY